MTNKSKYTIDPLLLFYINLIYKKGGVIHSMHRTYDNDILHDKIIASSDKAIRIINFKKPKTLRMKIYFDKYIPMLIQAECDSSNMLTIPNPQRCSEKLREIYKEAQFFKDIDFF